MSRLAYVPAALSVVFGVLFAVFTHQPGLLVIPLCTTYLIVSLAAPTPARGTRPLPLARAGGRPFRAGAAVPTSSPATRSPSAAATG